MAVTPYGVAQAFRVATDVAREDFVLFAGVLEARKGIDVLHEAVRRAGLRLVLAGRPGWGIDQELAAVRGDPAVELVVGPSDARLADLYARALVLAYPSRMEGFGLPVAEAMAAGCPVVCSDLPAIREWAADAPLYVAPGDPGALAAALERVARDGALRAGMAEWGRAVAASLTWERVGEAVAREIEAVLGARAGER